MLQTVEKIQKHYISKTQPVQCSHIVALAPTMVRGMGMYGTCGVAVTEKMKLIYIEGPTEGCDVGFDELIERQRMFPLEERLSWFLDEYSGG